MLLSLAALYVLACAGCVGLQRRMIYFPPVMKSETVERLAQAEGLERWKNSSGKAIGWKRLSPVQPAKGQVLVVHGNASCAFQCGHYAHAIQQVGPFDVFIVEFPGYADRPGAPSERTLDESAAEAFQVLASNGPVYLVGESLGTGVAAFLAGQFPDKVSGVVLFAPYNRLAEVAQAHIIIFPARWILRDRFPAEDELRHYHGPVAILIAGRDWVVPARLGRRLYVRYAGSKRIWEFPDANHGTLMEQPAEIWKQIIEFWQPNPQIKSR